jgi:hypothetical protein
MLAIKINSELNDRSESLLDTKLLLLLHGLLRIFIGVVEGNPVILGEHLGNDKIRRQEPVFVRLSNLVLLFVVFAIVYEIVWYFTPLFFDVFHEAVVVVVVESPDNPRFFSAVAVAVFWTAVIKVLVDATDVVALIVTPLASLALPNVSTRAAGTGGFLDEDIADLTVGEVEEVHGFVLFWVLCGILALYDVAV